MEEKRRQEQERKCTRGEEKKKRAQEKELRMRGKCKESKRSEVEKR